MKTILLGQNKIPVPAIIQGTMRFDRLTTNEVAAMFHNDLENGTNFVDTANCYGKPEGLVESIIGKTFAENPGLRDKLVLQSFEQIGMGNTVGESLTQKFEFILNEKAFFTEAFRSDDYNSVKEHDFELILQFYKDLIARKTSRPLEEEMEFLLEMYCRGSVYMTEKWVLGGMKDTPRRMSDKLVEAMPPKLEKVFSELELL